MSVNFRSNPQIPTTTSQPGHGKVQDKSGRHSASPSVKDRDALISDLKSSPKFREIRDSRVGERTPPQRTGRIAPGSVGVVRSGNGTVGGGTVRQQPPVNPAAVTLVGQNVQRQQQGDPGPVSVTVPGLPNPVQLRRDMLPPALRNTPGIEQQLQAKVTRGGQYFSMISKGEIPENLSFLKPENAGNLTADQKREKAKVISDLSFFLQAQGEAKVGAFSQGAFSLPDPKGNLAKFLTSYPNAYQRMSSHMEEMQGSQRGDRTNPGTEHYGLDLHDDGQHLDTCLPAGKGTILFGRMPKESLSTPDHPVLEDRLFFKMEEHGTGGGGTDRALHNPPGQAGGKLQKIKDFFGHAGGWIRSFTARLFGDNSPAGTFKERIPGFLAKDYGKLIKACGGNKAMKAVLERGDYKGTSGGFRVMAGNIEKLEREFGPQIQNNPKLREAVAAFKQSYLGPDTGFDNPAVRIGQEVILTDAELGGAPQMRAVSQPVSDALLREGVDTVDFMLAGQDGDPNGRMINKSSVKFTDPNRWQTERNMTHSFVVDFLRSDFVIGEGEGAVVGREHNADGSGMTEVGFDKVKNFFHSSFPDNPAAGDKAMRVLTSLCNQSFTNQLPMMVMTADPASSVHGLPFPTMGIQSSYRLTANPDGTYTLRGTLSKQPFDQMTGNAKDNFWMGPAHQEGSIQLDPKKTDYRYVYELRIDPKATQPDGKPQISVVRFDGYANLVTADGQRIKP